MALTVSPMGDGIGARITGIDIGATPVDDATFEQIAAALDQYLLLSFPQQTLGAPEQVAFAARFGPLDIHILDQYNHPEFPEIFLLSNEVVDGKPQGLSDAGSYWHSDFAFRPVPAYVTMLHAKKIPPQGGNTLFSDMYAAHDALDAELRKAIAGRRAVQRYRKRADTLGQGTRVNFTPEQAQKAPDVMHPLIRVHPESGRPAIFAPVGTTAEIEGLPADESAAVLKALFAHITQDRFITEYVWATGDLVFWDNRFTMHKATSDQLDPSQIRTLYRTTSMGEVPLAAGAR
ncbi:MAG: TauD/TfdA dioxygenase family protein [Pararhodobacter sp.]